MLGVCHLRAAVVAATTAAVLYPVSKECRGKMSAKSLTLARLQYADLFILYISVFTKGSVEEFASLLCPPL